MSKGLTQQVPDNDLTYLISAVAVIKRAVPIAREPAVTHLKAEGWFSKPLSKFIPVNVQWCIKAMP